LNNHDLEKVTEGQSN